MKPVLRPAILAVAISLVSGSVGHSNGLAGQLTSPAIAGRQTAPLLFEQQPRFTFLAPQDARVRRRTARISSTVVDGITGVQPVAAELTLNLFPTVVYTAILEDIENTNPGRAWIGRLQDEPLSSVVLAVVDGAFSGHVSLPGALYQIEADADGTAVIAEVDPALLPPEGPPVVPPTAEARPTRAAGPAASGRRIDVAIFFTPRASGAAGGEARIRAAISAAVAQTNKAFTNSGIDLRLRTVFVGLIDYEDSGDMRIDLRRLKRPKDKHLDAVHEKRDATKADLVHLIQERDTKLCGIAYILRSSLHEDYAFGVTARRCLANFTLAHELGHNLGAHHDWYVTNRPGWFEYSHGYVDLTRRFLTIMAYHDACFDRDRDCTRIAYFSNPNKHHRGGRLGVKRAARTNCQTGVARPPCAADNRWTVNKTRNVVANFR